MNWRRSLPHGPVDLQPQPFSDIFLPSCPIFPHAEAGDKRLKRYQKLFISSMETYNFSHTFYQVHREYGLAQKMQIQKIRFVRQNEVWKKMRNR